MKKALFVMLASLFVVASLSLAACGDDDDDAAIDNVAACQELEDTINGLECLPEGGEVDMMCDSYADYDTCDYSDYYNCVGDCYGCDGDVMTFDTEKYAGECADLATDIASTC
jgi:hypothetical protein